MVPKVLRYARRQAQMVAAIVFALLVLGRAGASIWQKDDLLDSRRTQITHEMTPYSNALTSAIDRRLMGLEALAQGNGETILVVEDHLVEKIRTTLSESR